MRIARERKLEANFVELVLTNFAYVTGALCAYPAGDFLGRRYGIILFLCLFFIGVALQTAATTLATFTVGRVFAGLGVGGTSCLVPM